VISRAVAFCADCSLRSRTTLCLFQCGVVEVCALLSAF